MCCMHSYLLSLHLARFVVFELIVYISLEKELSSVSENYDFNLLQNNYNM